MLKDNGALGPGTRGCGIQAREVPSHLLCTGGKVSEGGVWANWRYCSLVLGTGPQEGGGWILGPEMAIQVTKGSSIAKELGFLI